MEHGGRSAPTGGMPSRRSAAYLSPAVSVRSLAFLRSLRISRSAARLSRRRWTSTLKKASRSSASPERFTHPDRQQDSRV
jgi:hypothetical protein